VEKLQIGRAASGAGTAFSVSFCIFTAWKNVHIHTSISYLGHTDMRFPLDHLKSVLGPNDWHRMTDANQLVLKALRDSESLNIQDK